MTSAATKQEHQETVTTDHGLALVPLGSGYHQSTDVFAHGRSVDTGLLAEALIYYDRLLITVDNSDRFADLIGCPTETFYPSAKRIHLAAYPPKERAAGVMEVCNANC